jgi:hypothetical protein
MSDVVYFVMDVRTGLVKIGYTGENCPHTRISRLNAPRTRLGTKKRLRLLGVVPCADTPTLEKDLHERFAQWARGHEWFMPSRELCIYISTETRGHACPQCLGPVVDAALDRIVDDWSARVFGAN